MKDFILVVLDILFAGFVMYSFSCAVAKVTAKKSIEELELKIMNLQMQILLMKNDYNNLIKKTQEEEKKY